MESEASPWRRYAMVRGQKAIEAHALQDAFIEFALKLPVLLGGTIHLVQRRFFIGRTRHARLTASEYEKSLAEQMLELRERECEELHTELRKKDDRLRFLYARADALSSALTLKEFSPRLSTTEEMKRFYNAVSRSLDPDGFTLHHVAERLADHRKPVSRRRSCPSAA